MSAKRWIPVAGDGWKFIGGFLVVGLLAGLGGVWFARVVAVVGVLAAGFALYFFRDPDRDVPRTEDVLSPADGRVMEVAAIDGEGYGAGRVIRIFLSVMDVHIQRSPVGGRVIKARYRPGKFLDARDPRAPFVNESNALEIETPRGRVVVRQIAGLIARRILCWARPEETLAPGERFGLIRFGSQVDLYLPADVEILVGVGQRVVGGVTAVARWGGHP
ncbi:MAG: phosphatidylserine decarboxylase family protein [Elusimicrobia bacterium]|nr:phosphatidylserine decarboxylase family protein [Elusimicrobiota bacterium]MBK7545082.1 phosphatidylserine decarboxylase family protein [Elusimicrobiota bacterium]MBK7574601.1 phosphatidylserine decarboxylase family protein [Elusimicrobiota bacterium]MBK8126748.1 phosphatidylserine decarboxylase family protein [Elusimicrobiota bacterium]MBK8423565.1 phosphatidylserine decarboxylase family protein [Elusimicrobiota bacterium]